MPEDRIDPVLRAAARDDQRTVYLWTFLHTGLEGHATPAQFSRPEFAAALVGASMTELAEAGPAMD